MTSERCPAVRTMPLGGAYAAQDAADGGLGHSGSLRGCVGAEAVYEYQTHRVQGVAPETVRLDERYIAVPGHCEILDDKGRVLLLHTHTILIPVPKEAE